MIAAGMGDLFSAADIQCQFNCQRNKSEPVPCSFRKLACIAWVGGLKHGSGSMVFDFYFCLSLLACEQCCWASMSIDTINNYCLTLFAETTIFVA